MSLTLGSSKPTLDDNDKAKLASIAEERKRREEAAREAARKIANKYIAPDGSQPINVNAEIERLAKLSALDYEQQRRIAAEKLSMRAGVLDSMVDAKRQELAAPEPQPAPDYDEIKRSAAHIIASENVLDLFAKEQSKVIAGEATNGALLCIVATSRLLDRAMNAAIKGPSAGGKSELRKRILDFFPPESVIQFTSLSEKALIYCEEGFEHKVLSMAEASATEEQQFQNYLLRELMSENRIKHSTVVKVGNEYVARAIEKNGPVSFLVTTTRNKLHAENETRMLSLEIDDSETQTRAVLQKVAWVEGLNRGATEVDYEPWRNYQRWLELGERRVVVPFADALTALIPPKAVRLRRDAGQVLRAVKVHALLHREHRLRDEQGQIIADLDKDYEPIRSLMNALLAEGSGVGLSRAMTETVAALEKVTAKLGETEGATAKEIARVLKLDKSAAWRRLSAACDEGFVANLEQRRGLPGKYRLTTETVEAENILPSAAKILEHTSADEYPPKSAQPCNRPDIAEGSQSDNGCSEGDNPAATSMQPGETVAVGCGPIAEPIATINPLDCNGKSPPVAGLRTFSGVFASRVCAQCNGGPSTGSDAPTVEIEPGIWLHRDCVRFWKGQPQ
jgi:hypothetical protein